MSRDAILFLSAALVGGGVQFFLVFHAIAHTVRCRGKKRLAIASAVMFLTLFALCMGLVALAAYMDQQEESGLIDMVIAVMMGYQLGNVIGFAMRLKKLEFIAYPVLTHSRPEIRI